MKQLPSAGRLRAGRIGVTLLLFVAVVLTSCGKPDLSLRGVQRRIAKEKIIVLAGGYAKNEKGQGNKGTNSREALDNCYKKGNRLVEIDFLISADKKLLCARDWDRLYKDGKPLLESMKPEEITEEVFKAARVRGGYTPMTGDALAAFMRKYTDLMIVTDAKEGDREEFFSILAEKYPDLQQRFIVQVYHEEELDAAQRHGFPFVLYAMTKKYSQEYSEEWVRGLREKDLVGLRFPSSFLKSKGFFRAVKETGLPLCVYMVNESADVLHLFDIGVDAVYTERIDLVD